MTHTLLKSVSLATLIIAGFSSYSIAKEEGDLLMRGRAIYVVPDESATTSIGGNVGINNDIVPELDFTYFLTDNIGVELILATTKHHVTALNTALGASASLGSVMLLPPTLTFQYHFNPKGELSPYVGAGINYTFYYSEKAPGGAITDINYNDGFGFVLQAGVDYQINEEWSFNVDVKRVWLNTDVKINGGAVTADVDINPWVFGVGFGYSF
ncbi:MAG: OmpW family protein [Emcibacter sp.]|nr:OmpW family protein [Emcibacter sp.]